MNNSNRTNIGYAVFFAVLSALAISLSAASIKWIGSGLPLSVILFIRFLFGFIYISFFIMLSSRSRENRRIIKFSHMRYHFLRAFSGLLAMFFLYHSLEYIPLVDGVMLSTTYPLFIPIIMFLLFKIRTSLFVSISLLLGFIGIIFVLQPTSAVFQPQALFALAAGLASAVSLIVTRILNNKCDVRDVLFHYFLITVLATGIITIFNWKAPNLIQLALLFFAGITGTLFQDFLTRALCYASSRVVSPMLYFNIFFSSMLGWIFWHHIPNLYSWLGIVAICIGSISVIIFNSRAEKVAVLEEA